MFFRSNFRIVGLNKVELKITYTCKSVKHTGVYVRDMIIEHCDVFR